MPLRLATLARNVGSAWYIQYSAPRRLRCRVSKAGDALKGTTSNAERSPDASSANSSKYRRATFFGSAASRAQVCMRYTDKATVQTSSSDSGLTAVSGTGTLHEADIPQGIVKLQKVPRCNPGDAMRRPVAQEANRGLRRMQALVSSALGAFLNLPHVREALCRTYRLALLAAAIALSATFWTLVFTAVRGA